MGGIRVLVGPVVVALLAAGCSSAGGQGSPDPSGGPVKTSAVNGASTSSTAPTVSAAGAQFADPSTVAGVFRDVRAAVEAINTYDYRNLPMARRRSLGYVTGKLTGDFERTFDDVVARNAAKTHAKQRAQVDEVGIVTLRGATATLLVFGTLDIDADTNDGRDPFTLTIRAARVGSVWKLSKIDVGGRLAGEVAGTPALVRAVDAARITASAYVVPAKTGQNGVETVAIEQAAGTTVDIIASARGYEVADGMQGDPRDLQLSFTMRAVGRDWVPGRVRNVSIDR